MICAATGFTGKERDSESGLDYFGARYFSAAQGRFTSPDEPFADQDPADPQSWNLFGYVRNNPLTFVDPSGQACVVGPDGKEHDDNNGGQSCADAHKASENNKPSATVTGEQGSLLAFLMSEPVPSRVDNNKPLSEDAQKILTKVGQDTAVLANVSEKAARCAFEASGLAAASGAAYAGGDALYQGSQPTIPKPFAQGSIERTSPVATWARGTSCGEWKLPAGFKAPVGGGSTGYARRMASTRTVGALAGRIAPYVGWGVRAAGVVGGAIDAAAYAACMAR